MLKAAIALGLCLSGARAEAPAVDARNIVLLDGRHLSDSEAFNVPLTKGVVDSKRRAELLLQLRFLQRGLLEDEDGAPREWAEDRPSERRRRLRAAARHGRHSGHAERLSMDSAEEEAVALRAEAAPNAYAGVDDMVQRRTRRRSGRRARSASVTTLHARASDAHEDSNTWERGDGSNEAAHLQRFAAVRRSSGSGGGGSASEGEGGARSGEDAAAGDIGRTVAGSDGVGERSVAARTADAHMAVVDGSVALQRDGSSRAGETRRDFVSRSADMRDGNLARLDAEAPLALGREGADAALLSRDAAAAVMSDANLREAADVSGAAQANGEHAGSDGASTAADAAAAAAAAEGRGGGMGAGAVGVGAQVAIADEFVGRDHEDEPLQAQILSQKRLATYYGEIRIGDQAFRVLFDTGSCEFWVPSVDCAKFTRPPERCAKHARYDANLSKSHARFKQQNRMRITYLSGNVEGTLAVETVVLGSMTVTEQVVGVAEVIDVPLLDEVHWDGILGLAYPSSALARRGVRPVFDTVMASHQLRASVFGYYLGPRGGMVTFGGVDRRYIRQGADFLYASVIHRGYWTLGFLDVLLTYPAGEVVSTGVCRSRPGGLCRAIVDTGTYLVYGPKQDVTGPLRDLQSTSCAHVAGLPSITFELYAGPPPAAGARFVLPPNAPTVKVTLAPRDYTLEFRVPATAAVPADECSQAQYDHPDGAGIDSGRCVPDCVTGIAPDADSLWTLGQVFLRNYYAVFDRDADRIGFAAAAVAGAI